jgi:hypothetical protein
MRDKPNADGMRWFSSTPRQSSPAANIAGVFLVSGALFGAVFLAHHAATPRPVGNNAVLESWNIESAVRDVSRRVARDSIRRVLVRLPDTPRVQLLATPETQAAVRYATFKLVDRNDPSATGRVVGVVIPWGWDSLPGLPASRRGPFSMVPSQTDGRTCVTWITVATGGIASDTAYRGVRPDNWTGPCHLVAAYGLPSSARMSWLDARDWRPAREADPTRRLAGPDEWDSDRGRGSAVFMRALERTYVGRQFRLQSGLAARCMYGDGAACKRHVFGAGLSREASTADSIAAGSVSLLLSARLIQRYGHDRFRAWWTSPDTSSAGFTAAFGEADTAFARRIVARDTERRLPVPTLRLMDVLPPLVFLGILMAWLAAPARRGAAG